MNSSEQKDFLENFFFEILGKISLIEVRSKKSTKEYLRREAINAEYQFDVSTNSVRVIAEKKIS